MSLHRQRASSLLALNALVALVCACSGTDNTATCGGTSNPCGGSSTGGITANGGANAVGGTSSSLGGNANSGGSPASGGAVVTNGGTASGGRASGGGDGGTSKGGKAAAGGSASMGGSNGGTPAGTGAAPTAGGTLANGGKGGALSTGGTPSAGGKANAGGSSGAGGNANTGGAAVGGTPAAGGKANTGGTTSTGGNVATGGAVSTGGNVATGGNATGGSPATGGTTSTTCSGSNPTPQSFTVGLTWYSQTSANNCAVPWPSDGMYLALSTNLYDSPSGSSACGKCIQVTGSTGITKTLVVVDQCPAGSNPPCTTSHLDLSQAAYQAVQGSMTPGSIANGTLNAKFVPCPVSGNVIYHVGTLQTYYAAFVIMNTRYGIRSISYRAAGSTAAWTPLTAPTDADPHWVIGSGQVPAAMDIQITSEWGQVVVDSNVRLVAGDVTGGVQFPNCS